MVEGVRRGIGVILLLVVTPAMVSKLVAEVG